MTFRPDRLNMQDPAVRRAFRGRRGGYPVLFRVPRESLSLIALAAFSRWAYRNRSAFLPITITAAAFAVAVILHWHHQHWCHG